MTYLAKLSNSMKILWCYLIWYVYFALKYFISNHDLWVRSLGIALLVGFALNINAFCSIKGILRAEKAQVFRFFAIPFCVSSFPVLISGKGFFVFFSPSMKENLSALSLCAFFMCLVWLSRMITNQSAVCVPQKLTNRRENM